MHELQQMIRTKENIQQVGLIAARKTLFVILIVIVNSIVTVPESQ